MFNPNGGEQTPLFSALASREGPGGPAPSGPMLGGPPVQAPGGMPPGPPMGMPPQAMGSPPPMVPLTQENKATIGGHALSKLLQPPNPMSRPDMYGW